MNFRPSNIEPSARERLSDLELCLSEVEAPQKELFVKTGKSRTATFCVGSKEPLRIDNQVATEIGHALRVGDEKRSLAWFRSGWPQPRELQTIRVGHFGPGGLFLPGPSQADDSLGASQLSGASAPNLSRPLLNESEVRLLIVNLERHLRAELGAPFRLTGRLEDGAAQSWLLNGHGVTAVHRARGSSLRVEVTAFGRSYTNYIGGGTGVTLRPRQIAQRLIDRVTIGRKAVPYKQSAATALLAPQVVATLVSALADQFLRPSDLAVAPAISLKDDPTAAIGANWSPTDGEGVATRPTRLIECGERSAWLRPWDNTDQTETPTTGCRYRNSWRDLPSHRCSNLVMAPSSTAPGVLLSSVEEGVYLVASDPIARRSKTGDLLLNAVGFKIQKGATLQPISTTIRMPRQSVLDKVVAIGRDSELVVPSGLAASVTAPSAVLEDIELLG